MSIQSSKTNTSTWRRWVKDALEAIELPASEGGTTVTTDNTTELTGDVIASPTTPTLGALVLATSIDLPNITEVDGGGAGTDYSAETSGPYGVASGGGSGIPDGGTVGQFLIKDSATNGDATWQDFGVPGAGNSYSPGYNYSQASTTAFTVDLVNALNLFRVGRRIKVGLSGVYVYGVVNAVDFDTTAADDTHVTLTMEGSGTVPATIDELELVSSDTAWSPIATDPFSGGRINEIATGVISGTQWWVAVGEGGLIYTSTNAGVTWTSRTSGTSAEIITVAYMTNTNSFWVGGRGKYFRNSTDGITWTDKSALLTGASHSAADDIICDIVPLNADANAFVVINYDTSAGGYPVHKSNNEGTSWTLISSNLSSMLSVYNRLVSGNVTQAPSNDDWAWAVSATVVSYFTSYGDGSASTAITAGANVMRSVSFDTADGIKTITASSTGALEYTDGNWNAAEVAITGVGSNSVTVIINSVLHGRTVLLGDSASLQYVDHADLDGTSPTTTAVANGLAPTANFTCGAFNENDGVFIACADNGQILRSTNGTN